MRFANVPAPAPERRAPATDFLRRLIGAATASEAAVQAAPSLAPAQLEDLPRDLDQRVRLVGEW
jgi:hypothetical protein